MSSEQAENSSFIFSRKTADDINTKSHKNHDLSELYLQFYPPPPPPAPPPNGCLLYIYIIFRTIPLCSPVSLINLLNYIQRTVRPIRGEPRRGGGGGGGTERLGCVLVKVYCLSVLEGDSI